jgi:hypothetical protein
MTAAQQLDSFLDRYTPEVASRARAALAWMRRRFPGATLLVYDNYNALAIGFATGPKASSAVFSIALYPRWVTLFFLAGAALPDPHRRLKGSGTKVRHLVLTSLDLFDDAQILDLIDRAAAPSGIQTLPGQGDLIIKSISAKQRPRRPS